MARIALVTGAASGIGYATAIRLAEDGMDVAVNDLAGSSLDSVMKEIAALGRRSHSVFADVSEETEVEKMISEVVKNLGGLDVLVANAGIIRVGSILDTTVEDFDTMMKINARGEFLCIKHAAQTMVKQGRGGRIVCATSLAGIQGQAPTLGYCASKFAIVGIVQSAAAELAKHKITVNAYAPGIIETPFSRSVSDALGSSSIPESMLTAPIGKTGQSEDVAHLISFLASEKAIFVTGQTVGINGGVFFS